MDFVWAEIAFLSVLVTAVVVIILLYRECAKRYPPKRKALRQAFVLGSCILAALIMDEHVIRFIAVSSRLSEIYTISFAVKWEAAALLATLIITWQYWWDEREKIDKIERDHFWYAVTALVGAIVSVILAIYFLFGMLFAPSRGSLLDDFAWHYLFVFLLSCCFLAQDFHIWKGVRPDKDPKNDLRNLSHLSVYLVDLPVSLSFLLLGLFCGIHLAEHSWFHFLHRFLHDAPKPIDPVNLWTSEEYFISGAIAFQYLLSTTIYLILALGLVEIRTTSMASNQSQETRIEFPG